MFREGDHADAIFFVLSGLVSVRLPLAGTGRDRRLATLGAGVAVGEMAFLDEGQRSADVVAERDSMLARLVDRRPPRDRRARAAGDGHLLGQPRPQPVGPPAASERAGADAGPLRRPSLHLDEVVGAEGHALTHVRDARRVHRHLDLHRLVSATSSMLTASRKWSRRKVRVTTEPTTLPSSTMSDRLGSHRRGRVRERTRHVPAEEAGDERVGRPLPHVGRCADLFDAAGVHHDQAVGERERLVVVVGDEEGGELEPHEQRAQLGDEPLAERPVERAERFVEHEEPRLGRERAGERDALLLAARELADASTLEPGESDQRERGAVRVSISARGSRCMRSPNATLPCTSRWGNSAWSWNMSPKPRRCGGTRARSSPSHETRPRASGSRPATARSSELLPLPLGPRMHTISPSATSRSTPATAMKSS